MKKIITPVLIFAFLAGCVLSKIENPPNEQTSIINGKGYFYVYGPIVTSDLFIAALKYFNQNHINYVVIEIHSPGGYLHSVQRMIGYMDEYKNRMTFETRTYGLAASAGFLLFINGDKRLMSRESSYILWHKIRLVGGDNRYGGPTPAQIQAGEILQRWMDEYVASKCKLLYEHITSEIDDDLWIIFPAEAIKFNLADGYIEDI